jgi:catechol 2,3-dioxygenase-like lactoylglutathione lyase family enzyme
MLLAMIERIDHLVLTVRDIDRAVAFYSRVLRLGVDAFGEGRKALTFGNQKINLQSLGQETRNNAGIGSGDLCLVTRWTVEEVLEHLSREAVEVVEGPVIKTGALGPITSVYFNDPDGNLIEIARYD